MALTDTRIRSLKPSERPYRKTDSGGLVLVIQPSGARLWRYRYRIAGKENMFAIGAYPEISLKEARERRDEARRLLNDLSSRASDEGHRDRIAALLSTLEG